MVDRRALRRSATACHSTRFRGSWRGEPTPGAGRDGRASGALPLSGSRVVAKTTFPLLRRRAVDPQRLEKKDYSEEPETLGAHLKKRRQELGLLQRQAGERIGVSAESVAGQLGARQDQAGGVRVPLRLGLPEVRPNAPPPEPSRSASKPNSEVWVLASPRLPGTSDGNPGTLSGYLSGTLPIPSSRLSNWRPSF